MATEVERWLTSFGGPEVRCAPGTNVCPDLAWAASGAMTLTGAPGGPPELPPGPVMALLAEIDQALRVLSARIGTQAGIDAGTVLGARAGLQAMARQGRISPGGATRLLATIDGWAAVSLAREADLDAVPAMVGGPPAADPWKELAGYAAQRPAAAFVDRIRLFGVPAAVVPDEAPRVGAPWQVAPITAESPGARLDGALVVDLSSLWAGPLCAQVLGRAGARVVKVESTRRPDGARRGDPRFYDWLHAGQQSVAVDFKHPEDQAELAALLSSADVVIEASRPRALHQLGLAHDQLELRPGVVWLSITGHGRRHPELVAFGDDAAASGGLLARTPAGPVFCGDAIADPLTGVVGALAVLAARAAGGGLLVDLAMSDVAAAFASAPATCPGEHLVEKRRKSWFVACSATGQDQRVLGPRVPEVIGSAPALGADNERLLVSADRGLVLRR